MALSVLAVWDMAAHPAVVHLALEAREVPREIMKMTAVGIGFDRRARLEREASAHLDALEFRDALGQRAIERIVLPEAEAVLDPVVRPDLGGSLFGADRFPLELVAI